MKANGRYGYRAKPKEEEILLQLSQKLDHETISDTIRFAVRFTARAHGLLPEKQHPVILDEHEAEEQQKLLEPAAQTN